ncbi:MAG TPA: DegT/DnrJ/EryC1/StrS family aminotransferase [Actinomycetes bacterium]|nr:DegT/DnrJ/EryC1/StrS family aminotransferase [Actinomycetes bacterium]
MDRIPVIVPWLGAEEAEAASNAIASGWIAQGPRVAAFERAFARAVGGLHAVALSSCTAALHLAMVAVGVRPGDEVVVPSLSFIATANAVRYVGATPVFADVDGRTGNLSAETVQPLLTEATKVVLVVHQGGVPAPLDEIRALCEPLGIVVLEDAACAVGSTYDGRPVGDASELAVFSFHPRKLLTTGEGGMLLTTRLEWAERARRLREHGMSVSAAARHASGSVVLEEYVETGWNYRMTDVQAAVGLVQLGKLGELVSRRRELAGRYRQRLAEVDGLQVVTDPPWGTTNYQSFWVVLPEGFPVGRNELLQRLLDEGVSARRGIMAAHLEPAYADVAHGPLPETERLTRRSLILPLFHQLTEAQQDHVVDVLVRAANGSG